MEGKSTKVQMTNESLFEKKIYKNTSTKNTSMNSKSLFGKTLQNSYSKQVTILMNNKVTNGRKKLQMSHRLAKSHCLTKIQV